MRPLQSSELRYFAANGEKRGQAVEIASEKAKKTPQMGTMPPARTKAVNSQRGRTQPASETVERSFLNSPFNI
jgi:hypothetical protein